VADSFLPPSAALALFMNRGGGRLADPPKELRDKVGPKKRDMVEFKFDV
jgi:hypothetical protein